MTRAEEQELLALAGAAAAVVGLSVAAVKTGMNVKLSKSLELGQFLKSSVIPGLRDYSLSQYELANVQRLATRVLQPLIDRFPGLVITSGGRPPSVKDEEGRAFVEALRSRGYAAANPSQHQDFSAADFTIYSQDKAKSGPDAAALSQAFMLLSDNEYVRQVILYLKNKKPAFIHVGINTPKWGPAKNKYLVHDGEEFHTEWLQMIEKIEKESQG